MGLPVHEPGRWSVIFRHERVIDWVLLMSSHNQGRDNAERPCEGTDVKPSITSLLEVTGGHR